MVKNGKILPNPAVDWHPRECDQNFRIGLVRVGVEITAISIWSFAHLGNTVHGEHFGVGKNFTKFGKNFTTELVFHQN